jgi:hypothetical protein
MVERCWLMDGRAVECTAGRWPCRAHAAVARGWRRPHSSDQARLDGAALTDSPHHHWQAARSSRALTVDGRRPSGRPSTTRASSDVHPSSRCSSSPRPPLAPRCCATRWASSRRQPMLARAGWASRSVPRRRQQPRRRPLRSLLAHHLTHSPRQCRPRRRRCRAGHGMMTRIRETESVPTRR